MSETKQKKTNKKTVISALKVLSFVLALIISLQALSATLFAKEKTERFSDTKYFYSTIYTRETPNTIQVGLFGNSDLYSAFCPAGMFYMYGYTGTVVAAPRQTATESYYYLVDFLETQTPELVIFEADMFYPELPKDFEEGVEKTSSGLPTIHILNDNTITDFVESYVSAFKFHDRWKQLIISSPDNNDSYMHGYYFNKRVNKEATRSIYIEPNDKIEPMTDDDIRYVTYAKELCDEKGIEFMLMDVPSANTWSYSRHNGVQALADELGVNFLDMSIEPEGLNIDYSKDFRDNGNHLNYYGAMKATEYASRFIYENYDLTNNRYNEDYSGWIDDLDRMYEEKGVKEFLHFKTKV